MSRPKIVVFAIGNDARGDDALGPRIGEWLSDRQLEGVEVFVEYQLQVEHALDLREAGLVLFIDAAETGPAPHAARERRLGSCRDCRLHRRNRNDRCRDRRN